MFADQALDALDKLGMVGGVEQIHVIDFRAFNVVGEDESGCAGLADDLANKDVLGVLFNDKAAYHLAGFEMDDIVFPFVAAWIRTDGCRRQPQRCERGRRRLATCHFPDNCRRRLTISMAVNAASKPLLPALAPARFIACSSVSHVNTPKMTGTPVSNAARATPDVT